MKTFIKQFIHCGITGWCWECFWTGLHSLRTKEPELWCRTSLWMFPIYGCAAVLCPLYRRMRNTSMVARSFVYALLIFTGEYISGSILRSHHACPWNYSDAKLNVKGLIRIDYLPYWMIAGLVFEKIVLDCSCETEQKSINTAD